MNSAETLAFLSRWRPARAVLAVSAWPFMSLAPGSFAETPRLADLLEETVRHRRSLSEFVGTTAPLAIEGSQSGIEIEIPFSPRIEVLGGEVEILHDHAARPADWSSQLGISWDDRVISSSTI